MGISVSCTQCAAILRAPEQALGKKVRCPRCENVVPVPRGDEVPAGVRKVEAGYEQARGGIGRALHVISMLASDPFGGQWRAMKVLGEARTLQCGLLLNLAFVFAAGLLAHHFAEQ